MENRTKTGHFIYWLRKYLITLFFPRMGIKKGYRREWITWKQYKMITNGLKARLLSGN